MKRILRALCEPTRLLVLGPRRMGKSSAIAVAGEEAEWHLRDLMQSHACLSFVCAGSEVSVIRGMLARERAFFRAFELLSMGPVEPDHLGGWIDDRLEGAGVRADGVGAEAIRVAGPRTQDVVQVARHVHARGMSSGRADPGDVSAAAADVVREEDPVIRSIWLDLTAHQQNVLRAVAGGVEQLFSAQTRHRFGLPTSSTVATAVEALERRGLLVRDPETGAISFDSPLVRLRVEKEPGGDVPPFTDGVCLMSTFLPGITLRPFFSVAAVMALSLWTWRRIPPDLSVRDETWSAVR